MKFKNFQLRDYEHFYSNLHTLPYWVSKTKEEFDNSYLNRDKSFIVLKKLLIFQYHNESFDNEYNIIDNKWKPVVYEEVKNLMIFLDRKRGKQNTNYYLSQPNAGKTLFLNLISEYLISSGEMSHWNRNNNFPLQMCGNARVIFWNEPNYESSVERNLLKLLGGDSLNASKKNVDDVVIANTPMFVSSNTDIFPSKPEFIVRIKYIHWKSCPYLARISGFKLHPLCLLIILQP